MTRTMHRTITAALVLAALTLSGSGQTQTKGTGKGDGVSVFELVRIYEAKDGVTGNSFSGLDDGEDNTLRAHMKYGDIEGDSIIDTFPELLSVNYLSPADVKIVDTALLNDMSRYLPSSERDRGIALCEMWMKRRAENQDNASKYRAEIEKIKKKARITEAEITAAFNSDIENHIRYIARAELRSVTEFSIGEKQVDFLTAPLIAYYRNPCKATYEVMVKVGTALNLKHQANSRYKKIYYAYENIIKQTSGDDFFIGINIGVSYSVTSDKNVDAEKEKIETLFPRE